tara:strand:+ start:180 stop:377 length:198 start_codon:yes stop_codon:yes gene_type:complete
VNAVSKKMGLKSMRSEVNSLRKSLLNYKFQKSTGQLEKTSEIKKTRRKIASLKTIISQQKGNQNA